MNRNTKYLARLVSTGAASASGLADFKAAMLILGWEGKRGQGVVNHVSGERAKSWAALADLMLETPEARAVSIPLDVVAEPETEDETEAPEVEDEVQVVYFYTTRTPTISLTDRTSLSMVIQDDTTADTEGECQSGAALACEGRGFLRVLPESMLPGQDRTQMIQCVPCYEASAEAYVRKLHS